jgi:hypothetical protein
MEAVFLVQKKIAFLWDSRTEQWHKLMPGDQVIPRALYTFLIFISKRIKLLGFILHADMTNLDTWRDESFAVRFVDPTALMIPMSISSRLRPPGRNPAIVSSGLDVKRAWVARFS